MRSGNENMEGFANYINLGKKANKMSLSLLDFPIYPRRMIPPDRYVILCTFLSLIPLEDS